MYTLQGLSAYSHVATAAYAEGLQPYVSNRDAYKAPTVDMSDAQALAFDATWAVIEQSDPNAIYAMGFSAVLLQRKDAVGNATGEKVLAIAGTDSNSIKDLITDLISIVSLGTVAGMWQYAAFENFYAHLKVTGKIGLSEQVILSGHSLGGFLAQAFTVRNPLAVAEAYTFNAPGFGDLDATLRFVDGVSPTAQAKITNVVATDGEDFTVALGTHKLGKTVGARIEAAPLTRPQDNHSIIGLGDALAMQAAYATLQPVLTIGQTGLLLTASGLGDRKLEDALDGLRTVFINSASNDAIRTPTGDRDRFYVNLQALQGDTGFQALSDHVQLVPGNADFASSAQGDTSGALPYRFALLELLPIAVVADTEAANQTLYGGYTQRLSLYDEHTGQGELTRNWLADRATLVEVLVERNIRNNSTGSVNLASLAPAEAYDFHWSDASADDNHILAQSTALAPGVLPRRLVAFGGDANNGITGSDARLGDHLYGGAGTDTLSGLGGNDYLEGNADDDTLKGGAGADELLGGGGFDSYVLDARDGAGSIDTILDGDGSGRIEVVDANGATVTLNGGTRAANGSWLDTDHRFTYSLADEGAGNQALLISGAGVQAKVSHWSTARNLGIVLDDAAPVEEPDTDLTIAGDLQIDSAGGYDDLGNPVTTGLAEPGRADKLFDSTGDDLIQSLGGDDVIFAERGGTNAVEAGSGRDLVYGGAGQDWVEAGSGRDYVGGGAGDDTLWGGDATSLEAVDAVTEAAGDGEADLVNASAGDDLVIGGAGRDGLLGEDGADTLVGGAGDDNMFGDRLLPTTQLYSWDWQRRETVADGGKVTRTLVGFGLEGFPGPAFGTAPQADLMMGGAGDDWMFGDAGDDILDAGTGSDVAYGGPGADFVKGGEGADEFWGDGSDADTTGLHWAPFGGHGNDVIDGGAGDDYISGDGGDDYLAGGEDNDEIDGDSAEFDVSMHGDDVIDGGDGNDRLWGNGGDDVVDGGPGADQLVGEAGDDTLEGGEGDDSVFGDGSMTDPAQHGDDDLYGDAGDDALVGGGGDDWLQGGDGNDNLFGDAPDLAAGDHGTDQLEGGNGDDHLDGMGADDWLDGGAGADTLIGGEGDDTLVGGAGLDVLLGGAGNDTYVVVAGESGSLAGGVAEQVGDLEGVNTILISGGFSADAITLYPNPGQEGLLGVQGDSAFILTGLTSGHVAALQVDDGPSYSWQEFHGSTWVYAVDVSAVAAASQLVGGRQSDHLTGSGGSSSFWGGKGDDVIVASGGNNTFRYRLGDGVDSIQDNSGLYGGLGQRQRSTLAFGAGVDASALTLGVAGGALELRVAGGAGAVRLAGFDAADALAPSSIDRFTFADGTELSRDELLARGFDFTGTGAAETITGTSVGDRLTGGAGDDMLAGGAGADTYVFNLGDGNDVVADGDAALGAADTLRFGPAFGLAMVGAGRVGADLLLRAGADSVTLKSYFGGGPDAVERIEFSDGTPWTRQDIDALLMQGTSGDDVIVGDDQANVLSGQAGTDRLEGGLGDDTYLFRPGDGQDLVVDTGGIDTVRLGDGIAAAAVQTSLQGIDLVLDTGGGDRLVLGGYMGSDPNASLVELIAFADGTNWSRSDVVARLLSASDGGDRLFGFSGDDTIDGRGGDDLIDGGAGNDTLIGGNGDDRLFGGPGSDTYVFASGSGNDMVDEATGLKADLDRLSFAGGVARADVAFARQGLYDLQLTSATRGLSVRVVGQFGTDPDRNGVEQIAFADGQILDRAAIEALQVNDNLVGTDAAEVISGLAGDDVLYGRAGNDTLRGGSGSDRLYGGPGDDVFEFAPGGGADTVSDLDPSLGANGGTDTLSFAAGISALSTTVARQGGDLALSVSPTDRVLIEGYFARGDFELLRFADGTAWNQKTVAAKLPINGTTGADSLSGTMSADVINGLANPSGTTDTIYAGDGDDVVDGGAGRDVIYGGNGDDVLKGGTETANRITYRDVLYGEAGNDVIQGGKAPADMYGGDGNDVITGTGLLDGRAGNNLMVGTSGAESIRYFYQGNNIIAGGAGVDDIREDYYPGFGDPLPLGRNVYLYNNGDGADSIQQNNSYSSANDVVSVGKASYSQFKIGGGAGWANLYLQIGKVGVPGTNNDSLVSDLNDTKYLQIIVSSTDYSATSTDPLKNRKVVVIDWDNYCRDYWATTSAGGSWNLLGKMRQHLAWSSDTLALGGMVAYQYGTVGNVDTVSDEVRFAVLNDPNLGLAGQPIAGAPATAAAVAGASATSSGAAAPPDRTAVGPTTQGVPSDRWFSQYPVDQDAGLARQADSMVAAMAWFAAGERGGWTPRGATALLAAEFRLAAADLPA